MSLPSDNPMLDARGLVFPADGSVLNQVGLAVGEGETVAVLGAQGAGKSALMSCLSGESIAAAGTLWTNGKPIHLLSPERRRAFRLRHYGLVHQSTVFLPELTLAQATGLPLRFAGVGQRAAAQRAHTWLTRFEIEGAAHLRPPELPGDAGSANSLSANSLSAETRSTGILPAETLRRAALARAMVNEPLVLFADEPFIGLSDESTDTTMRILRSVARSHGTAVIVFTRDTRTATRCERIVHLVAGRTAAEPVPVATATPVRPPGFPVTTSSGAKPSPARVAR